MIRIPNRRSLVSKLFADTRLLGRALCRFKIVVLPVYRAQQRVRPDMVSGIGERRGARGDQMQVNLSQVQDVYPAVFLFQWQYKMRLSG